MDTPERNQIGTPISKIEESPFSNFVNSLSPINPIKTHHVSQTFNSLSFTSPPSVFTSPHVTLQKESRFLRRHQHSDLAKTHFSCDKGNKDSQAGEALSADHQPDHLANEQVGNEGVSGSEGTVEPPCNVAESPAELQRMLKYDSGSPDHKIAASCGIEQNCEAEAPRALVPFVQEPSLGGSFGAKLNSQERDHDNEEASCDWQSLISGTTDLFIFDSPNDAATLKGPFQKSLEEETSVFGSLLSRFPRDDGINMQTSHHAGPVGYNEAHETMNQSALPSETSDLKQTDHLPENVPISSLNGCLSGDSGENSGNERGMRRRCLIFEMPRAKNNIDSVVFSSSSSMLQSEEKPMPDDKQPITPRDSSRCILPGIGLHLNALAAASKDYIASHQDASSPTNQEALMKLSASSSSEKNVSPAENENGAQVVEDSSQAFTHAARKFENGGEEGCKRCNCKKSKCLKLYCECFAAGVYCMDSCSCQDCFNKPIHEDTVLATRKQIESRNPLAFAPKVIRSSDSAHDLAYFMSYCRLGPGLLGAEAEIEEAQTSEKHVMDKRSDPHAFRSDEDQSSEFTLPKTPLRIFRPSVPLSTSSKGKPPRSLAAIRPSAGLHPIDGPGRSTFLRSHSKIEKHFRGGSADEIPTVLQNGSPPSSSIKTLSPNGKRVSPPHHSNGPSPGLRSSRKLILQSIPSFPSLTPRR
ncbi:hypothetical protein Cgig2_009359 [Carnegiea gigantea]|uniref:CRC domain-containing protein n=1 Tax=Carnegiea gigantea TaxID=171969 RepID=A0A9Q1GXH3_9CARY|nr:hypothetical protein Cgig2_009359 [Carnegiea gigantea]